MALSEGIWGTVTSQHTGCPGRCSAHLAVWLDAVLEAVELPAGVAHLATGLANMDGDALTLKGRIKMFERQ